LITRETVFFETAAIRAMSLIVARRPRNGSVATFSALARGAAAAAERARRAGAVFGFTMVRASARSFWGRGVGDGAVAVYALGRARQKRVTPLLMPE
jgi:hypothetical protein